MNLEVVHKSQNFATVIQVMRTTQSSDAFEEWFYTLILAFEDLSLVT